MEQLTTYNQKFLRHFYQGQVLRLYRFFYYKTNNKTIAEDLTSKTFLRFAEALNLEQEINKPVPYLYGVAKNVFLEYLRQKYKEVPFTSEKIDFLAYVTNFNQTVSETNNFSQLVSKYIGQLPDKQRRILYLRLVEKKSLKTIANMLEKNMSYVKTTQQRGINRLKELLERDFNE